MSSNGIERLAQVLNAQGRQSFAPRAAPFPARVSALVKEASTGIVTGVRATLVEGGAEVEVPVPRGTGVREGATVTLLGDATDPTQPLRFGQIDYSDDPSAGNADDADLAYPEWGSPDHLSLLLGPQRATLTIYWYGIDGKGVSGYQPSLRRYTNGVPGDWTEPVGIVPHLGGTQLAQLGANFAPGEIVDVQIRAFYPWAHGNSGAFSVPGDLKTFVLAVDDISPGDAIGLTGNVIAPGILELAPQSNNLNSHFREFIYELATGASGPLVNQYADPNNLVAPLAAGTYFAAVYPLSTSGTPGGRYPGTGYAGPFVVLESAAAPDLIPPPQWAAPLLLKERHQEDTWLTVTLPTAPPYAEPSDYDFTQAIIQTGIAPQSLRIGKGQASGGISVPFGTTTVSLVGYDKEQNPSTASPTATVTLGNGGAPSDVPILTTSKFALAALLSWTTVESALGYEVQRAPDVSGGPGTYVTVYTTASLGWLDTLPAETAIQPTYWYRVRAFNFFGNGPYSIGKQQQLGKMDGQNIRLNSITAQEIAGDIGIFNKLFATQSVISAQIATGNTFTPRLILKGQIAGDPYANSLIAVTATEQVLAKLTGDALTFFRNDGVTRAVINNNGMTVYGGGGAIQVGDIEDYGVGIDTEVVRIAKDRIVVNLNGRGGVGTGFLQLFTSALASSYFEKYDNNTVALTGPAGALFVLRGLGGVGFAPPGGNVDVSLVRMTGASFGTGLDMGGGTFKARDIYALRSENPARGYHFMGNSGAHVGFDGTNYVMPGYNLVVNGVTVSSSAEVKRSIRAAKLDTAKAHGLRARRFRLRDDPQQIERLGFLAEEVRAVLPEAVHELDPTPLREGDTPGSPLGIDLMALCAAQQELIGDLLARVTKLETATLKGA